MYAISSSPKFSLKEAKLFTTVFIIFSLCFAVPDFYAIGIVEYNVDITTNVTLKGRCCTDSDDYKNVRKYHSIAKAITIMIITVTLVVIYSLIAGKIRTSVHGKGLRNGASHIRQECRTKAADNDYVNKKNPSIEDAVETNTSDTSESQNDASDSKDRRYVSPIQKGNRQILAQRITLLAFLMTVVSIGSLIPFCVIKFASPLKKYEYPLWMSFLYHTYVLSSCANPFFYRLL
ncbi:hypothetical protein DPMN_158038 [Dreissena polymorpha]|uniref:G-protein coupled receptors family 1 profile domain-containing protein n=1 Tax=Dreissena polymorpha TaxID=45954 RepID=A0A9D4IQK2_DREPO|nr:hypothetical protein DPMN_158038 [Dreissena polymorpha]